MTLLLRDNNMILKGKSLLETGFACIDEIGISLLTYFSLLALFTGIICDGHMKRNDISGAKLFVVVSTLGMSVLATCQLVGGYYFPNWIQMSVFEDIATECFPYLAIGFYIPFFVSFFVIGGRQPFVALRKLKSESDINIIAERKTRKIKTKNQLEELGLSHKQGKIIAMLILLATVAFLIMR